MKRLAKLNVTVYVSGSIACYKTLSLIRLLKKRGAHVRVVMTDEAQRFVKPLSFRVLSGNPVICRQTWDRTRHGIAHVDLARWTDLAVIMPATANLIAKVANGIADDVASTCLLATSATKLLVPAMNNRMWLNPATQRNVCIIDADPNVDRLGPVYGRLAEGYSGTGRMVSPQRVVARLDRVLRTRKLLSGTRLLVTAGGTQEPIDPVRFITNGSTGKMGYAIASQAEQMGADVTLISGHTEVPVPAGVKLIKVRTTEDMARAVLTRFPNVNVLIMAAALADFKPDDPATQKIKKRRSSDGTLTVKFRRTPDVLRQVARIKQPRQLTIGFAAETQNLIRNAAQKLRSKRLDLIVANDVAKSKIGFGSDQNQVTFIDKYGDRRETPVESKGLVADQLLKRIAKLKDDRS